jgi:hypothetical protein
MRFRPNGRASALATLLIFAAASPSAAQPPSPLDTGLWSFPGSMVSPGSATLAGLALADRWLGLEPFDNPATPAGARGQLTGLLHRVNRQDLRTDARSFDETSFFLDASGAWATFPLRGLHLAFYLHQPVLRVEENAFLRGEPGGPVQPAVINSNGSTREIRGGAGLSGGSNSLRLGAAIEWTRRSDLYEVTETSGSPDMGFRHLDFTGDGFGVQAGVRWAPQVIEAGTFSVGAQARWTPAIDVEGEQRFELVSGDSIATIFGTRESMVEGGVSACWQATAALRVIAGGGGRTQAAWNGFDVESGPAASGSIAVEFHDSRDPWTLRFGLGLESEDGVPEDHASSVGLGIGWLLGDIQLDIGVLHRSISREPSPTSYDDRVALTLVGTF